MENFVDPTQLAYQKPAGQDLHSDKYRIHSGFACQGLIFVVILQPFLDMCREVLKIVQAENEAEKGDTSITIETQAQTSVNDSETKNILDSTENQGNWCCSIS